MELIAKIFQNGRSQAVRIPKAFRFRGSEVKISKKGDKVILEPLERSKWPEGFWDIFFADKDFKTPEALSSKNFSLD
ncbi:MAG: AbrB/MazE/SpoVT family DNA-binding domain-containing protein [Deltaproteobacteria bacterium]|nr:AbrB/MazE/SpoVT family DNA-binding domain-containing protein [Deltaproteobacteria bacterium]